MLENQNLSSIIVARAIITDRDRLFFVRRSETDSNNPGMLEGPGGKLDLGETIKDAVVRETEEETGLRILPQLDIIHYCDEVIQNGSYRGRYYLSAFCMARVIGGTLELSGEHSESQWLTFGQALNADVTPKTRDAMLAFRRNGLL